MKKVTFLALFAVLALTGCESQKEALREEAEEKIAAEIEKAKNEAIDSVKKELTAKVGKLEDDAKEQIEDLTSGNGEVNLDDFAECLKEGGAKVYGTAWCSHCKHQKEIFGDSIEKLGFVDCGENKEECEDAGISGYPTWVFDGKDKETGVHSLKSLAEKTDCELPAEYKDGPRK